MTNSALQKLTESDTYTRKWVPNFTMEATSNRRFINLTRFQNVTPLLALPGVPADLNCTLQASDADAHDDDENHPDEVTGNPVSSFVNWVVFECRIV